MYPFRIKGYIETIRPYQKIAVFKKSSRNVMQLPCDLHNPGPVIRIGNRSVIILRQTSGFRIKNQIHAGIILLNYDWLNLSKISVPEHNNSNKFINKVELLFALRLFF